MLPTLPTLLPYEISLTELSPAPCGLIRDGRAAVALLTSSNTQVLCSQRCGASHALTSAAVGPVPQACVAGGRRRGHDARAEVPHSRGTRFVPLVRVEHYHGTVDAAQIKTVHCEWQQPWAVIPARRAS